MGEEFSLEEKAKRIPEGVCDTEILITYTRQEERKTNGIEEAKNGTES